MSTIETTRPERSFMDDPQIKWRHGKPNYDLTNEKYMKERSTNHQAGSLEKIVENLVKTWEVESSHKADLKDWQSIVKGDDYYVQINGGRKLTADDNLKMGNYLMLLEQSPYYDVNSESHDSSHEQFKEAFPAGFPWEVLEVFTGPPTVSFSWRHWTEWTGPFKGHKPTGQRLELNGSCVAEVTTDLKIKWLKIYYDPTPMIAPMTEYCPFAGHNKK